MQVTDQIEQALFSCGIVPQTIREVVSGRVFAVGTDTENFVVEYERGAVLLPARIADRQTNPIQNLIRKISNAKGGVTNGCR